MLTFMYATAQEWYFAAADYAVVLNKATVIVSMGKIQPFTIAMLVAAYLGLVILTVFINGLSLRLRLIFYKQRRSKVRTMLLLLTHPKAQPVSHSVGFCLNVSSCCHSYRLQS